MPKVNSYAPGWLCRPSPGAKFLSSNSTKAPAEMQQGGKSSANGPTRTIAKRGNEVFAVIDNEIRWSNLARLKDQWEHQVKQKKGPAGQRGENGDSTETPPYRVCAS